MSIKKIIIKKKTKNSNTSKQKQKQPSRSSDKVNPISNSSSWDAKLLISKHMLVSSPSSSVSSVNAALLLGVCGGRIVAILYGNGFASGSFLPLSSPSWHFWEQQGNCQWWSNILQREDQRGNGVSMEGTMDTAWRRTQAAAAANPAGEAQGTRECMV